MPGAGTTVVGAPATVDIAEKFPEALQLELLGQLCTTSAAGCVKLEFTNAVTAARCGFGRPVMVSRYVVKYSAPLLRGITVTPADGVPMPSAFITPNWLE